MTNTKKEIPYLDRSYVEKRKILRQYYTDNVIAYELVAYIIYHCDDFENKILNKIELLKHILVDGYIAYEKIYDQRNNISDYEWIDASNLTIKVDSFGKKIWQYNVSGMKIIHNYSSEDILYLTYKDMNPYTMHTSLVEQVMLTGLTIKNKEFINIIIDNAYKLYIQFDKNMQRKAKLERLMQ
jgi:hypothetical protein